MTHRENEAPNKSYKALIWSLRQLIFPYMIPVVEGLENIPPRGPAIIAGNHPNILDGLLIGLVGPRPTYFLVARELVDNAIMGGFFKAVGGIAVDRSRGKGSTAYHNALTILQQDKVVGIFPEGRTNYGSPMHPFRPGAALMALKTGSAIVPVAIWGTQMMLNPNSKIVTPGRAIIIFGQPIVVEKVNAADIPEAQVQLLLAKVQQEIEALLIRAKTRYEELKNRPKPYRMKRFLTRFIIIPLSAWLIAKAPNNWVDEQIPKESLSPDSAQIILRQALPTLDCFNQEKLPYVIARDPTHLHFRNCQFCAERALALTLAAQKEIEMGFGVNNKT